MKRLWLIFAQAVTVTLGVVFVLATIRPDWLPALRRAPPAGTPLLAPPPRAAASTPLAPPAHGGLAVAARIASPAVVSVAASKTPQRGSRGRNEFFDLFGPRGQRGAQLGLGSGVIISADGVLLTNNHVVEGAADIEVQLSDGRQVRATLVGTDPETDVAVLKIDLPNLPVIPLGDAKGLQVGDAVLAIGNPFNVGQTVTSGIVSALGRNQLGINVFENFIQTDAAINPGNSGGALVDERGRLVGINTAIFSRSGGSLGIGFAIPVDVARQVADSLLKDGVVTRGWIGVQPRDLTPELADALKLGEARGVLVAGVVKGAPAALAGIKPGDVLVRIGTQAIGSPAELLSTVAALKPRSQVEAQVQRERRTLTLTLNVAQRPRPAGNAGGEDE
ncbi:MAG: 2-alkenal reductase [Roseateles depolymerans]|uniref:2-alkenal reductase n=1 Tax=Roseateles depolymerans TaxID=76731 RepID=A0A2W5DS58_9BURK|nr:MAG: 2-alkenal reductase [Roseateles depolymerans]